ncbi:MAG: peptide chain release factor-like protein [Pirellulaceae bacterium]|nr:peptide chain release factor-like protein [Planctomycetales bacterium]
MHNIHPSTLSDDALLGQCLVRRQRRSGPGGQHRNKVETAVILRHEPTGIEAAATERRSQAENRSVALARLRLELALHHRYWQTLPECPSDLWQTRCHDGRLGISPRHRDFPALLAEALDVLALRQYDAATSAQWLQCSPSQLLRLLRHDGRALAHVNRERCQRHLRPYH